MDSYTTYIENNWYKFKDLKKLNKEQINNYKEPYKMYLYIYYGFLSKLNKYNFNELNLFINDMKDNLYLFAAFTNNIKALKYLESKGLNIHYKNDIDLNAYTAACINSYIKTMKYLQSKNVDINYKKTNIYVHDVATKTYILKNKNYKLNKYSIIYFFGS